MHERIPIGNYPLWAAKLIRWVLEKRLPKGTTILLRGRGPRRITVAGVSRHFYQSIPLKHATRAGIYIIYTLPADIVGFRYRAEEEKYVRILKPDPSIDNNLRRAEHPLDAAARRSFTTEGVCTCQYCVATRAVEVARTGGV